MFRSSKLLRFVCFVHLVFTIFLAGCTTDFDVSHLPAGDAARDGADATMDIGFDVPVDVPTTDGTDIVVDTPDGTTCPPCGTGQNCCGAQCVDLLASSEHCGTCEHSCPGTACVNGQCLSQCVLPFIDCDSNIVNGCEVNAATDAANCGACGRACASNQVCNGGSCACDAGRGDCDGMAVNGCESDTETDALNCGACNHACGAGQACVAGVCACATGFSDCDSDPANGCEVETDVDAQHCGSCATACGTNAVCNGGMCACAAGFLSCGSGFACTTSATDPNNCGACGNSCPTATPVCSATGCSTGCAANESLCGSSCADTSTDVNNCGDCGIACTAPAGSSIATCTAGVCGVQCQPGYADCNGLVGDGCEVDARVDTQNCGACGAACAGSQVCIAGVCGCPTGTRNCGNGVCAACCTNADCNDGDACTTNVCTNGTCAPPTSCAAGTRCCGALGCNSCCTDSDCNASLHQACGADLTCGACAPGFADCDRNPINGCEADLSSITSCGACGTVCGFANAGATCTAGACALGPCSAGFGNCDGNAANGCETNLSSSNASCGTCGNACTGTGVSCVAGTCAVNSCPTGTANCDGSVANGCEVNLVNDPNNCGGCGTHCTIANGTAACVAGACAVGTCNAGYGDCDGNPSNGCETNLNTDPLHCGTCTAPACSLAHASATCSGGTCTVASCNTGFGNCDGSASNGCETDLNTTTNCGTCGTACSAPANAAAVCSAGTCRYACNPGSVDCNGVASDGCEVANATDTNNCGLCGNACPAAANATTSCAGGSCQFACAAGYGNCNGLRNDGCEAPLNTVANCGGCGVACHGAPHASPTCDVVGGVATCGLACDRGYTDCDNNPLNGCEVATARDRTNCGTCGNTCTLSACLNGSCQGGCGGSGMTYCSPLCTDRQTDRNNCGSCGTRCSEGQTCNNGSCQNVPCIGTQTACGGQCTSLANDPQNCGACGNVCPLSQACASGTCANFGNECVRAPVVNLGSGPTTLSLNLGAGSPFTNSQNTCVSGADAFLAITVAQNEVVYVDTFASGSGAPQAQLALLDACPTAGTTCAQNSCASQGGGGQAQLVRYLVAGTYYLLVDTNGSSTSTTPVTVTIQHFRAQSASATQLAASGSFAVSSSTTSSSNSLGTCGPGPDQTYYWTTCPSSAAGMFNASTCSGASFDTVLQQINGSNASGGCNNNDFTCSPQSTVSTTVPAGAGLHALVVDGASSSSAGAFTVTGTRP